MLVLSRKKNERVQVGAELWVSVVDIRGDKVRLGFEAPAGMRIWREELVPAAAAGAEEGKEPKPQGA